MLIVIEKFHSCLNRNMFRKVSVCRSLLSKRTRYPLLRHVYTNNFYNAKSSTSEEFNEDLITVVRDRSIIHSSYLYKRRIILNPLMRRHYEKRYEKILLQKRQEEAIPFFIESALKNNPSETGGSILDEKEKEAQWSLPFSKVENVDVQYLVTESGAGKEYEWDHSDTSVQEDIAKRMEAYEKGILIEKNLDGKDIKDSYTDDYAMEDLHEDMSIADDEDVMRYGTCDKSIPVSKVPCGGCGSMLHCQDQGIPGFVPKELFADLQHWELRALICQRCHFLKHHNMALNVRVSPEVYEKVLEPIKDKMALVLVIVDLLDVPCSIWPNLIDIIGTRRPVIIVGNKVDLLPADGKNHLQRIKDSLMTAVNRTSLKMANIKSVALVSAFNGFGIEKLITEIQNIWGVKGDIFIVGCTNSGKSTLFNTLLGSDLCKVVASDLIRRATTSPWPGTTLNMLKFPVLRPSKARMYYRMQRLMEARMQGKSVGKDIEYTNDLELATLSGPVVRTFAKTKPPPANPFALTAHKIPKDQSIPVGIKENSDLYALSKWCYDTPGTIQPDQIINLLTHEELMMVLPKKLIIPRTYSLSSGKSLFIGGLARLDLLYCTESVRFTVFAAQEVPLTVVKTVDASSFYRKYLGSPLLGVPFGDEERLQHWPVLKPCGFSMVSEASTRSCGDIVLSSAGWVTLTTTRNHIVEVRGWTPGGRGIYLRSPAMLPLISHHRGRPMEKCPAYGRHRLVIPKINMYDY